MCCNIGWRRANTSFERQIAELKERIEALERASRKTTRGRTNQRGAAEYLGKSVEWLRLRHNRGQGPPRGDDGSYSYDDLDKYAEKGVAA
jgi:hypothetical protein